MASCNSHERGRSSSWNESDARRCLETDLRIRRGAEFANRALVSYCRSPPEPGWRRRDLPRVDRRLARSGTPPLAAALQVSPSLRHGAGRPQLSYAARSRSGQTANRVRVAITRTRTRMDDRAELGCRAGGRRPLFPAWAAVGVFSGGAMRAPPTRMDPSRRDAFSNQSARFRRITPVAPARGAGAASGDLLNVVKASPGALPA
jgi:hypothetical protein